VKALRRQLYSAGLLLVGLAASGLGSPADAQARREVEPDARILVATFLSEDRGLGVQGADAVRSRVQSDVPLRQLHVIEKKIINETLEASGYRPDSALSPSDVRELAKLLRADEILDGRVLRTADGGVRVEARLLLARDAALAQPLPVAEARNVGEAARAISRDLREARKQLQANRDCENALREGNNDKAIDEARKGIAAYPQATLARLCWASALQAKKAAPDEILAITDEVLRIDPRSRIALELQYAAAKEKGDDDRAVASLLRVAEVDPRMREAAAIELARMDANRALPLVRGMVEQAPEDIELLRLFWAVQLRASDFRGALQTGEQLAAMDPGSMDSTFYTRMILAYSSDSQPQKAAEMAARAVQAYPNDANTRAVYAQMLRRSGQLQQAVMEMQRAVELNPAVEAGLQFVIVTYGELNQTDSAFAFARRVIASGADQELVGNALLASAGAALQAAQEAKTRAAWLRAYDMSRAVDELAPTANSKFYVGLSSFQVGLDALQGLARTRSCPDTRLAEEMWAVAEIAMPQGGRVNPEAAGQVMSAIQQYSSAIQQYKRSFCR
jgi:tetratricopeptide (TPR) repeat protein